jgi:hypothetical protein
MAEGWDLGNAPADRQTGASGLQTRWVHGGGAAADEPSLKRRQIPLSPPFFAKWMGNARAQRGQSPKSHLAKKTKDAEGGLHFTPRQRHFTSSPARSATSLFSALLRHVKTLHFIPLVKAFGKSLTGEVLRSSSLRSYGKSATCRLFQTKDAEGGLHFTRRSRTSHLHLSPQAKHFTSLRHVKTLHFIPLVKTLADAQLVKYCALPRFARMERAQRAGCFKRRMPKADFTSRRDSGISHLHQREARLHFSSAREAAPFHSAREDVRQKPHW